MKLSYEEIAEMAQEAGRNVNAALPVGVKHILILLLPLPAEAGEGHLGVPIMTAIHSNAPPSQAAFVMQAAVQELHAVSEAGLGRPLQ